VDVTNQWKETPNFTTFGSIASSTADTFVARLDASASVLVQGGGDAHVGHRLADRVQRRHDVRLRL
jgi:hypothetical protein